MAPALSVPVTPCRTQLALGVRVGDRKGPAVEGGPSGEDRGPHNHAERDLEGDRA